MQNYEEMLLTKLRIITSRVEGAQTLEKKLEIIIKRKDNSENRFLSCLLNMLEKNEFTKGIKRYRDDIFKLLFNVLNIKKYNNDFYLKYLSEIASDEFKKIMYISLFIGRNKNIELYNVLYWILDEQKFNNLKKLKTTEISSQDLFIKKILDSKMEDMEKEAKNSQKNYNQFLRLSNEEIINYINQNDNIKEKIDIIKEKDNSNNHKKDINKDKDNDTNDTIDNNINKNNEINDLNKNENKIVNSEEINKNIIINEEKIKSEEKLKRIKELICKNIAIKDNEDFPERTFLELNSKKILQIKEPIKIGEIYIDNYEFKNESKYYLFSPISLILNNKKKNFDKNDFELFNEDNYYIELFGNYLEIIIDKLNNYINDGTDYNFIEENKIRLGCYNERYYICCKINNDFKNKYLEQLETNKSRYKKDEQNIDIIQIKNSDEDEENATNKINDKKAKEIATHLSLKTNKNNYRKKMANLFEKQVRKFLSDDNCEDLQNLVLFFNFKYPIIKDEKIIFDSIRLSFSPYFNNLYGFREIDVCFKNKNGRILNSDILLNNLCYQSNKSKFKKIKQEQIDVSLNENSIIFCEVKNSFGNITYGTQNCSKI